MVKVPDGITDVHPRIRHENLPDADLVGFAVPGPVLGAQRAAGSEIGIDTMLPVLRADPIRGSGQVART
jgi:hypothetical protein